MPDEKLIPLSVSIAELEDAACHLGRLAQVIGMFFSKLDFEGKGEMDRLDVQRDIMTGHKACLILLAGIQKPESKLQ